MSHHSYSALYIAYCDLDGQLRDSRSFVHRHLPHRIGHLKEVGAFDLHRSDLHLFLFLLHIHNRHGSILHKGVGLEQLVVLQMRTDVLLIDGDSVSVHLLAPFYEI